MRLNLRFTTQNNLLNILWKSNFLLVFAPFKNEYKNGSILFQDVSITPLDCSGESSWVHGSSLINYMKLVEFVGLSGKISFDTQGLRTMFYLDVLELQTTGLEPIGTKNVNPLQS
jgi:hypothetical protein